MGNSMILVPVRTIKQGTTLNAGKLKQAYRDETSTVEFHVNDMARLGLTKGDTIRMISPSGSEAIVSCKERKNEDAEPGMVFMAYGPISSRFMEDDTAGSGMPISKHLPIEIEGPLTPEGDLASPSEMPAISGQAFAGQLGSPLSQQQSTLLNSLTGSPLTAVQAAWLSGYFSAMSGGQAVAGSMDASTQPAAPGSTLPLMTVLFGSQTGNGEGLAEQLKEQASARGFNVAVHDMTDYNPANLASEKLLFVIVSTHGEGDPPVAAEELHEYLQSDDAARLESLKYAVFALGDTSYEKYCQTGRDFDAFLNNLGATRLMDCVDSDVDFEEPGEEWVGEVLNQYQKIADESGGTAAQPSADILSFPGKEKSKFSKTNPYPSDVLLNINISGEGSAKENRHIEFDLGDSGLVYEPGDALGVYPLNNPVYVDELLAALKFNGSESVTVGKETFNLREAFLSKLDITGLSRVLVEKYANLVNSDDLKTLLDDAHKDDFKEYIWGRQLIDLVEDGSGDGISPQDLVGILRKMPGRLYSIASALSIHENQVHLLVGAVRYHSHDRDREGVCSTFLSGRSDDEDKLLVYIQQNKVFRMPEDPDLPMIMVGPGTGVAPFRAYLQERDATGAKGKNWLFFGDQHKATDYVYEDEWNQMLESGVLTHMNAAFSRDQEQKIYVQTQLLENAEEIYAWFEEGAHFYVCGDAERMAGDVHKALIEIISSQGGKSQEEAEAYIKAMEKAKRYQRDVY